MSVDLTFRYPPVVETVLSVQCDRLKGLTSAHLGAFWERRRSGWPEVTDAVPLEDQFETFGKEVAWDRVFHLRLTQSPTVRLQMRNSKGDRMIQLQNCRLDYNWIALPGQEYPRYRTVRPEFDAILGEFKQQIKEYNVGELLPNQWEITYVNHMPRGTVWNGPHDWANVFRHPPAPGGAPNDTVLEGFGGHWHYELRPALGRLHVELQHAYVEGPNKAEALILKLTARGPIAKEAEAMKAVKEGLNLGHDAIVTFFEKMTSNYAHDYWNRKGPMDDATNIA